MTFPARVAVTGGNGRLGRYVVREIRPHAEVTVVDVAGSAPDQLRQISANTLDEVALTEAFTDQQAVLHLAAIPNPRTAPPEVTFRTNVEGTWHVLRAAQRAGVRRVVLASSDSVLGLHFNPPGWRPQYLPVDEHHPVRPTEVYSLSKLLAEDVGRSFADSGELEVIALRPTHIVFPPEWPELEDRGRDVKNYHLWAYVRPEDVAQAFRLALAAPAGPFRSYVISAPDTLCAEPTLDMVRRRWGAVPEVRDPAVYEANPYASLLGIAAARTDLGYAPEEKWSRLTWR
ncbi:NAD-dependent epimerase/dehydratase family protein [Actinacidiphila sp. ITFR-21]|uniref:NAD-dependent epimerase/dehydratase family protein n=1 Tax=Actinacidiphila sp. ITFR-21 TaxID=3075199 RepID=UPI00288962AC|nr:NAD(P)-dependent oxidoreductase [Streptomyces sp. ITFR-21]WNI18735.1 NAD(P)-dependent oxidoreductase [Streptomyces sp. ITFR-21]